MAYSSITKPEDHFNTVTYAGNSSTQSITGVGFQPDWVWIKIEVIQENIIYMMQSEVVTKISSKYK